MAIQSDGVISPCSIKTVIGKGMPKYKMGGYGHLIIVFTVIFPNSIPINVLEAISDKQETSDNATISDNVCTFNP